MRKVVLYIGMSLDGYIADRAGNIDWLGGEDKRNEESSYDDFIEEVDTVLMGMTTYEQIITELSPDEWPYEGMKTYVFTNKKMENNENATFVSYNISHFVKMLQTESGKKIWVCGGASIANQLIEEGLIDEYQITVMPIILGNGIPLFKKSSETKNLILENVKHTNGMVDLCYRRRENYIYK